MALQNSHSVRWAAAVFHQQAISVENWRAIAESKAVEQEQLDIAKQNLQARVNEMANDCELQRKVLEGLQLLEQELRCRAHPMIATHIIQPIAPPTQSQTPLRYEPRCCSASDMSISPSPTVESFQGDL